MEETMKNEFVYPKVPYSYYVMDWIACGGDISDYKTKSFTKWLTESCKLDLLQADVIRNQLRRYCETFETSKLDFFGNTSDYVQMALKESEEEKRKKKPDPIEKIKKEFQSSLRRLNAATKAAIKAVKEEYKKPKA